MKKYAKNSLFLFIILSFIIMSISLTQQKKEFTETSLEKKLNRLHPPEKIMDAMDLKPVMVIGDIGAGRGRFTFWFADRVGETGKVYANDIDKSALQHLERRCKQHGFKNVVTVLGEVTETNIPKGVLDIAFMISVYHDLTKPVELVRNIIPTLKSNGILVIVEYDSFLLSKEKLLKKVEQAGFKLIKIENILPEPNHYIYFFRPKGTD